MKPDYHTSTLEGAAGWEECYGNHCCIKPDIDESKDYDDIEDNEDYDEDKSIKEEKEHD